MLYQYLCFYWLADNSSLELDYDYADYMIIFTGLGFDIRPRYWSWFIDNSFEDI